MAGWQKKEERLAAEVRVLQALCAGTTAGAVREEGVRLLGSYRFADFLHQTVFDALREMKSASPEVSREQLAARLTRQGFPWVDLEKFFSPPAGSREEVLALMRQLASAEGSSA